MEAETSNATVAYIDSNGKWRRSLSQLTQFPQSATALAPHRSRLATPLWWVMLVLSAMIAVYAAHYFLGRPDDAHFSRYLLPLRLHIDGGIGALLACPWQFSEKLRARALNVHRWLGHFYLSSVALGSVATEIK